MKKLALIFLFVVGACASDHFEKAGTAVPLTGNLALGVVMIDKGGGFFQDSDHTVTAYACEGTPILGANINKGQPLISADADDCGIGTAAVVTDAPWKVLFRGFAGDAAIAAGIGAGAHVNNKAESESGSSSTATSSASANGPPANP